MKNNRHYFTHESYDVYRVALEVTRWVRSLQVSGDLGKQITRASESMVLNIAEGLGRTGKSKRNHLRIALGSAAETCACLDVLGSKDAPDHQDKLRRVGAMLSRMT